MDADTIAKAARNAGLMYPFARGHWTDAGWQYALQQSLRSSGYGFTITQATDGVRGRAEIFKVDILGDIMCAECEADTDAEALILAVAKLEERDGQSDTDR